MICPSCGETNLPGADECIHCLADLAPLDLPTGHDQLETHLLEDPVWKLKPRPPLTILEHAPLGLAIEMMLEKDIGALLVCTPGGELAGILTERDFTLKILPPAETYLHLTVADFMTRNPETIAPDDALALALQKMDIGGYRHLPVVENRIPIGVISVRNVIKYITRLCKEPFYTK